MRALVRFAVSISVLISMSLAAACGGGSGGDDGDDDGTTYDASVGPDALPEPTEGFQIVTPDVELQGGEEATYCYYFHMPNEAEVGVKRWVSQMTAGSHHMILYLANSDDQPVGSVVPDCEGFSYTSVWTYSAGTPEAEMRMPADVGMKVPAGKPAYIQMHYLNTGDVPIQAHVTLNAETYAADDSYTQAAAYITYNTQISVGAGQTGGAGGTCTVPSGANFFNLSTHSHHFSTHTDVKDGTAMVLSSDDWATPTVETWLDDPHYAFASGSLSYHCDYFNDSSQAVETGPSAETDEMCMAVGYFFPATGPKLCINSFAIP